MTTNSRPVAIPDVRAHLDTLIAHTAIRVDNIQTRIHLARPGEPTEQFRTMLDHALGRLHGLKEARELLDTLEAPAPAFCLHCARDAEPGHLLCGDCRRRTIESDLLEDR